jgi:para-aminobenzoate synthetase / 4-amino-4-deoxychorismate lyase
MHDSIQAIFCECDSIHEPTWLFFAEPIIVIECSKLEEVLSSLDSVQRFVSDGLYAAGFLTYEAAPGLDEATIAHPGGELPLLWFGLFRRMVKRTDELSLDAAGGFSIGQWTPSVTPEQHGAAVDRIKEYIALGHTYQVNHTFRLRANFAGDAWSFFRRLCAAQRCGYGAYIDTGRHLICSASPELFFSLDGDALISRPMKGTIARGLTVAQDRRRRAELSASAKDRAENAMIVDMMRNDMGRVAIPGGVRVESAFDVEKYPTVYQMTSTVSAKTEATFVDVMKALFPPASITGAPKIRTMRIIRELEPDRRGVYTGCIGWLAPGRKARFNVAIRTAVVDRADGKAEYGVGGGIVWDSDKTSEYAECLTKAAVLSAEIPQFELLETILHDCDGYFLLDEHLSRLADSAEYFDFAYDPNETRKRLADFGRSLPSTAERVRLRVARDGRVELESAPLAVENPPRRWRLRLADRPISADNAFLYHKTTFRAVYESAIASKSDCDDVILWNEQGQLTETTIANLVLEKNGRLVTPPVTCGLLPGVFRDHLLRSGRIHEEIITPADLARAERIFAVNSVRRWIAAAMADE